jgi:hypothetical protein
MGKDGPADFWFVLYLSCIKQGDHYGMTALIVEKPGEHGFGQSRWRSSDHHYQFPGKLLAKLAHYFGMAQI